MGRVRNIYAYTDGSYRQGCGGYGIHFPQNIKHRDECGRLPFEWENSLRAEIYAVIRAIQIGGQSCRRRLTIYTDCDSVAMLQWRLNEYLDEDYAGGMRHHTDLLELLDEEMDSCFHRPQIRLIDQSPYDKQANREAHDLAAEGTSLGPVHWHDWIVD